MSGSLTSPPDLLPVLSRGKHRSSRKGGCFMEMASVLAGERWSDHPRCTHPLLAELARHVNDCTSDDHRHQLATLIPSVVGLTSEDPRVCARIALRCAQAALPIASQERQKALAVSVITADSALAVLDERPVGTLEEGSRQALESAPFAAQWAHDFVRRVGVSVRGLRRHADPNTVRGAVTAIAEACVPDPDAVLRALLVDVIADCTALCATRVPAAADAVRREPAVPVPAG
jgi:hypothetical protein